MKKYCLNHQKIFIALILIMAFCSATFGQNTAAINVDGTMIGLEFNTNLHSRVISKIADHSLPMGNFSPSEFIVIDGKKYQDFTLSDRAVKEWRDEIGTGMRFKI